MRSLALLPIPVLLLACEREPSFEERYSGAANAVEKQAREIDQDLTNSESPASCGDGNHPDCP